MMGAIEAVGSIMNSYPILWTGYGFLIFIPLVAIVSYFFWPKDSASYSPPKATATSPAEEIRAKDDISGRDSGIEASGETERGLRVSTSSDDRDQFSRTPDSLRSAEEEGPRTDSALGDPEDSQKPSNRFDVGEISVEVTDALDGPAVRFRGTKEGKRSRSSTSPSSTVIQNGISRPDQSHDVEESLTEGELEPLSPVWKFPPSLDDFDLMESDVDPSELEEIFADDRLIEVKFRVNPGGPRVGISIVGGSGSPNGDLPILVKRVLPGSLAEENGHLKAGDELVAVNETLLVGVEKDFAINALSRMEGEVRLLVLQDD